jgi:hypothetical protein
MKHIYGRLGITSLPALALLALAASGCDSKPAAPPPPPATGTATLSWAPVDAQAFGPKAGDDPVAGVKIYAGDTPDALHLEATLADPKATRYVVEHLAKGPHFFAIRSYTKLGIESAPTPLVSKVIE